MSALRVGMRVRLVKTLNFPQMLGKEGVIVGWAKGWDGIRLYVGWELDFTTPNGSAYVAETHELEPILYDGNQPVEWSECLWQPEGQAA